MIVHEATGLVLRVLLAAIVEAWERLTCEQRAMVDSILTWCETPGNETR